MADQLLGVVDYGAAAQSLQLGEVLVCTVVLDEIEHRLRVCRVESNDALHNLGKAALVLLLVSGEICSMHLMQLQTVGIVGYQSGESIFDVLPPDAVLGGFSRDIIA